MTQVQELFSAPTVVGICAILDPEGAAALNASSEVKQDPEEAAAEAAFANIKKILDKECPNSRMQLLCLRPGRVRVKVLDSAHSAHSEAPVSSDRVEVIDDVNAEYPLPIILVNPAGASGMVYRDFVGGLPLNVPVFALDDGCIMDLSSSSSLESESESREVDSKKSKKLISFSFETITEVAMECLPAVKAIGREYHSHRATSSSTSTTATTTIGGVTDKVNVKHVNVKVKENENYQQSSPNIGPEIVLGGWSYGGVVVAEIAAQMQMQMQPLPQTQAQSQPQSQSQNNNNKNKNKNKKKNKNQNKNNASAEAEIEKEIETESKDKDKEKDKDKNIVRVRKMVLFDAPLRRSVEFDAHDEELLQERRARAKRANQAEEAEEAEEAESGAGGERGEEDGGGGGGGGVEEGDEELKAHQHYVECTKLLVLHQARPWLKDLEASHERKFSILQCPVLDVRPDGVTASDDAADVKELTAEGNVKEIRTGPGSSHFTMLLGKYAKETAAEVVRWMAEA